MNYLYMEGKGVYVFSAYGLTIICLLILVMCLMSSLFKARKEDSLTSNRVDPKTNHDDLQTR